MSCRTQFLQTTFLASMSSRTYSVLLVCQAGHILNLCYQNVKQNIFCANNHFCQYVKQDIFCAASMSSRTYSVLTTIFSQYVRQDIVCATSMSSKTQSVLTKIFCQYVKQNTVCFDNPFNQNVKQDTVCSDHHFLQVCQAGYSLC